MELCYTNARVRDELVGRVMMLPAFKFRLDLVS